MSTLIKNKGPFSVILLFTGVYVATSELQKELHRSRDAKGSRSKNIAEVQVQPKKLRLRKFLEGRSSRRGTHTKTTSA